MDAIIGRRVHHMMWDRKITQTALAGVLGLQQSALSRKLRGERGWSSDELVAVAGTLHTNVADLFGEYAEGNVDDNEVTRRYLEETYPQVTNLFDNDRTNARISAPTLPRLTTTSEAA